MIHGQRLVDAGDANLATGDALFVQAADVARGFYPTP
jgi:hypothetical protein